MPYFLLVEDGIGVKGSEYTFAPISKSWVAGSEENYLQRWDGQQWLDTDVAAKFRSDVAREQAEMKVEEARRQKERSRVEDTTKSLVAKVNEIVSILNHRGEKIEPI